MFAQLLKAGVMLGALLFFRRHGVRLALAGGALFLLNYTHQEYLAWVEVTGTTALVGHSYILKNIAMAAVVVAFILSFWRASRQQAPAPGEVPRRRPRNRDDGFDFLRHKRKLRSVTDNVLAKRSGGSRHAPADD